MGARNVWDTFGLGQPAGPGSALLAIRHDLAIIRPRDRATARSTV